jgi:hypothetical protein
MRVLKCRWQLTAIGSFEEGVGDSDDGLNTVLKTAFPVGDPFLYIQIGMAS